MANLLRWSVGMALPKKKDENLNTNTPLINSLQTMNPIITSSSNGSNTNNNGASAFEAIKPKNFLNNAISRIEQSSGQTIQQLIQKQQEEEAQRQQRIAEAERQQEQRRQEENERKLRQQQEQQQKQRNLLNSAGLGNNFMTANELRSKLEAQKQVKTQQPTKQEEPQYQIDSNLKEKYNNLFKDEGNGWSNNSYWTKYRSNGSTAYKYNPIYWESQQDLNRALRTITSKDENAFGDADRIVSAYSKLSDDEKWSATQDLQKAANKIQQAMAKADNEGNITARDSYGQALDYVNTYQNLISGVKKGEKSFWKSLTDTAQSGGFVGDMARPITNALGDLTGRTDASKRIEDDASIARAGNNGIVSALDSTAGTVANIGLNAATGKFRGLYGLATAAMNLAHEGASAVNDQDRTYYADENGNVQRKNRTNEEKFSNIGTAGFNLAMSLLGMKGIGPNIKFAGNQPLQSLIANGNYGEIAKGLLKYAADEIPFAALTSVAETGIQSVGDKDAWSNYGKNLLNNIKGDVAMDIAGAVKYGKTGDRDLFRINQDNGKVELDSSIKEQLSAEDNVKIQQRLDEFQEGVKQAVDQESKVQSEETKVEETKAEETGKNDVDLSKVTTAEDGSAVKINNDGTATRLSDAEFARVIDQDTTPSKVVRGNTPFKDNSVDFRLSSDNVETLTKRALQGDTYAQRKLAELTNQNQAEETDWRGKSVEDVINPKNAEENGRETQDEAAVKEQQAEQEQNTRQKMNEDISVEDFSKLTPEEQKTYLESHSNAPALWLRGLNEAQLAEVARAFDIDPNGKSYTDIARSIQEKVRNPEIRVDAGENANVRSSFAENTSGNRNFSNETRTDLKSDPLTYRPTTNEERLARANEILSTRSTDEIDNYLRENFFNVKPKDADSADMVLAGEYAKMLDARGQYDRSTEIINRMSEIGTKQGQNIQALSLMMNRSPEGIANMAQNAIKKAGGQMTPELRKQIVEKTQEVGRTRGERNRLAQENAKISEQIMNGQGDLKALRKRQMAIAQEYRLNLDQEGRQFSQLSDIVGKNSPDNRSIFGSIWRAGLLSGPRTHTGNAVSNTFQNIINAGADRFASGLDWARSKITGTERQVVGSAGGRGKGLKRGLKAAGEVLRTGDNLWDSTDMATGKVNAWGQGGEMEFKNKIANTMVAKPTNFIFRAMSSGDLPFRYAAFENAIRTEAKRQGINLGYKGQALQDYINSRVATPDPELQAYGIRKGNEAVYDVDTKLSDVMARVDKFIDSQDNKLVKNGLKTAKTLVAPFVKIPSKVLSTAIDYSPLGSVKAIVNKVGSKNYTTGQFETDLARSGLGTAGFVGLGYALSSAGLLTGGYPEDKDERNRWKAEGIEPNSIKIGDKYVSMNYLGPMGMLTAMGAGIQQRQAKGEDVLSITTGTLMDTLNSFLDQSYVQGLSNAVNAVTDSQRYGESYVNSFARALTPNLLRQTATATDPKQRQVNNAGEAIISGIPGLSQTLDAKVDAYGREIENKQTLPLGQMWDALKINNSRETNDVIDEVSRLHSVDPNNKDLQVTPPMEDNTLSVNGTNVKITDEQKTQLQKDVGAAALKAMRQVMSSSSYDKMSDTEKAKALDKARSDAQTQVRKQFIKSNNITADDNPGTTNSAGEAKGDFSGKAISNAKSSGTNKKGISINESLAQEHKDILDNYNSMSSDDWEKYVYGTNKDSASAEYRLALAKYENDLANGDLTDTQKIKREKELVKLAVSQEWTKDYRDAYSLAGSKTDMQELLNRLDDETRAKTVGILNGLNNAMYEAGVITASTYKTRANAINNTSSKKSKGKSKYGGITSAEASALSGLAKSMIKGGEGSKVKTTSAPNTKRKMAKTRSSGNKLAKYSTNLATNVTVSKNTKKGA